VYTRSAGFYEKHPGRTIFEQEWRPLVIYVRGTRDTKPITPQVGSTDLIGGSAEVWSNETEFAREMISKLSPSSSMIVEPFMGQTLGNVGIAALMSGRTGFHKRGVCYTYTANING
jgi:hypothetical protein